MADTTTPEVETKTTTTDSPTNTQQQPPERYCQSGTVGTRGSRICYETN